MFIHRIIIVIRYTNGTYFLSAKKHSENVSLVWQFRATTKKRISIPSIHKGWLKIYIYRLPSRTAFRPFVGRVPLITLDCRRIKRIQPDHHNLLW